VGPLQFEKHIPPIWVYKKLETWSIDMKPSKPNSLKK